MPRLQSIVRVIDAMAAQQRVILWLECQHKVSITSRDMVAHPTLPKRLGEVTVGSQWLCPFCADKPIEKTVIQMWKEAGEPA